MTPCPRGSYGRFSSVLHQYGDMNKIRVYHPQGPSFKAVRYFRFRSSVSALEDPDSSCVAFNGTVYAVSKATWNTTMVEDRNYVSCSMTSWSSVVEPSTFVLVVEQWVKLPIRTMRSLLISLYSTTITNSFKRYGTTSI